MVFGAGAFGAHYGTSPESPPMTSATLSVSDQPSLCPSTSTNCVETTGAARGYPVVDGDRITLNWSNNPDQVDGVIHLGTLYLPLGTGTWNSNSPVTLHVELPSDATPAVVVEYAGTRHHVPLAPGTWQPITIYNPDERYIYLRLELPRHPPPN
jgi:hypothetical protein